MNKLLVACLLGVLVGLPAGAVLVKEYNLPQLVSEASLVVRATALEAGTNARCRVHAVLKGSWAWPEIVVQGVGFGRYRPPNFRLGEEMLVFLRAPDSNGVARLVGTGDQGKWPKEPSRGYTNCLDHASVQQIVRLTEAILRVDALTNLHERVERTARWLASSNLCEQLVGLDYLYRRFVHPEKGWERVSSGELERIIRRLLPQILRLTTASDPWIRGKSIRLLRYAPYADAIPVLIGSLTDPDPWVQSSASEVLSTFSLELRGSPQPPRPTTPGDFLPVQQQWSEWLQRNRERLEQMGR